MNAPAHQLTLDALLELREVEVAFTEEAVGAIERAGVELGAEYLETLEIAEDADSWIGRLVFELRRMNDRAKEDVRRLKPFLARILHENVDAYLEERRVSVQYEAAAPPSRIIHSGTLAPRPAHIPAAPTKQRLPRTPKNEDGTAAPTKRLTPRQQELLGAIEVGGDNIGRYIPKGHIEDWAALKVVMLSLGSKWKTKTGFAFPDDVDGAETVRIALESGEIIDWDGAGFFPTPDDEADRLVAMFRDLRDCPHVLEPSAGTGSLIRAMKRRYEFASFYACELIDENRKALERMNNVSVVANDFLRFTEDDVARESFEAVVMNPPFAKRMDVRHVTKAIELLVPGAELAAIASAGVKFRDDLVGRDFRALLSAHDAVIEDAAIGAFKASGTGVSTVRIWLKKRAL